MPEGGSLPEGPEDPPVFDEAAFAALFHTTYPALLRYAQRLAGGHEHARDAVQEAFLRLWQKRSAIDPARSVRALLYLTVRNLILNQERNTTRQQKLLEQMDDPTPLPTPDHTTQARLMGHRLRLWIAELPLRQREAFELSRFDGLRYEEIAGVMGVSIRTVENHIRQALRHLRDRLREFEPDLLRP